MSAIDKWFTLTNTITDPLDVAETARITALGTTLLTVSDIHLELITGVEKPESTDVRAYAAWENMSAQMAAELYEKAGSLGMKGVGELQNKETFTTNYSEMLLKLMQSKNFQRLLVENRYLP